MIQHSRKCPQKWKKMAENWDQRDVMLQMFSLRHAGFEDGRGHKLSNAGRHRAWQWQGSSLS